MVVAICSGADARRTCRQSGFGSYHTAASLDLHTGRICMKARAKKVGRMDEVILAGIRLPRWMSVPSTKRISLNTLVLYSRALKLCWCQFRNGSLRNFWQPSRCWNPSVACNVHFSEQTFFRTHKMSCTAELCRRDEIVFVRLSTAARSAVGLAVHA